MLDLSPAKWIWFPSKRTLANTFVLFRREVELVAVPAEAKGWIAADSRYRLTVNGRRVQWGPAPTDPRHAEADPVDLAAYLQPGHNCLGVEVLFYGHGEGTWPFGKPGLLLKLDDLGVVADSSWRCIVDRAHRPGQYRRWYLRSLQEEFDARLHPHGWDEPGFDDAGWIHAQELSTSAGRSAFSGGYWEYANEVWMTEPESSTLIERTIPLLREEWMPATPRFLNSVTWRRDPADWFEFRTPGSFEVEPATALGQAWSGEVSEGPAIVTFDLQEEGVGWPGFTIDAPDGTVVELMVQESHDHSKTPFLDSHFFAWTRFVCREGLNRFETFDYEAGRWLQLHVRNHTRSVRVSDVGLRRRVFPWPQRPEIEVHDAALQRLFEAGINTLNNSAQETIVDGMGRERQQYAGDGSHQLQPIRYAFGESRLPARYLRTFGQGQLLDGVFADSWPAVDRLHRLWQRNVGASDWGPLLDHSVGFVFDHYHHWMQTGDLEPVRQNWGGLAKFVTYLVALGPGLLPVQNLGENAVWIDHEAFQSQEEKRCAFNLYVAAMIREAFVPMVRALGEETSWLPLGTALLQIEKEVSKRNVHHVLGEHAAADLLLAWADRLLSAVTDRYWSDELRRFEHVPCGDRIDDRSLATAVLYDLCPGGDTKASVAALAARPDWMGRSYPANVVWNYWALAKAGQIQAVIDDLRERWAPMRSVVENNSLQEFWTTTPDTTNLMSHCPVAPLTALYQGVLGLWPTSPGFSTMSVRPQLGDLKHVTLTAQTPQGPVRMVADQVGSGHRVRLSVPARTELALPDRTEILRANSETEWIVA